MVFKLKCCITIEIEVLLIYKCKIWWFNVLEFEDIIDMVKLILLYDDSDDESVKVCSN